MNLRSYETRMPILIRLAPYIDVEVVRKRMGHAVKRILKKEVHMDEIRRVRYEEFVAGDIHVIQIAYQLDAKLLRILERLAGNRRDRRFHEAYGEFLNYFFHSDYFLGI